MSSLVLTVLVSMTDGLAMQNSPRERVSTWKPRFDCNEQRTGRVKDFRACSSVIATAQELCENPVANAKNRGGRRVGRAGASRHPLYRPAVRLGTALPPALARRRAALPDHRRRAAARPVIGRSTRV